MVLYRKAISLKWFLILFLFALTVGVLYYTQQGYKKCRNLTCLSLKYLEQFRLKEVYQDDNYIFRALLSEKEDLLRVNIRSKVAEDEADQSIQVEIVRMKALFENSTSPYPGEISDKIVCGKEFTPTFHEEIINGLRIYYFSGYLNDRLVFGTCIEQQVTYQGFLVLFYCREQKQQYQLEIIAPKEEFLKSPQRYREILESIKCRN